MAVGQTSGTKSTPLVCSGHTRPVPSISFSSQTADGSYLLISSCKDGKAMLRDGATGDWLGTFVGHKGAVWSAKLDAEGGKAITGSADFSAKMWDTYNGSELLTLPHNHVVRSVDITQDGKQVVTGDQQKKLRVWDLARPDAPAELVASGSSTAHDGTVRSVIFDVESSQVISAGEDKIIKWWDLRSGQCVSSSSYDDPIISMDRSVESAFLSVASGKRVQLLDMTSRQPVLQHDLEYAPSSVSLYPLSPHDRFVTGSTVDGWVRVHSSTTGEELEVYKGHHGPVHCISYSPDGALYASGSEDGTLRLWQTAPGDYGLWKLRGEAGPPL